MKINILREPFSHIIIDNLYSQEEYQIIWNELMYLKPFMGDSSKTQTARTKDLKSSKKGVGIFLHDFFVNFHEYSRIFQMTRKIFSPEMLTLTSSVDYYFKLFQYVRYDAVLLQFYGNGDYYRTHEDASTFSAVTLLHKEPKKYSGGELSFTDYKYTPCIQNNSCIIFPSRVSHEVKEVFIDPKNYSDDSFGRFTITQFLHTVTHIPEVK